MRTAAPTALDMAAATSLASSCTARTPLSWARHASSHLHHAFLDHQGMRVPPLRMAAVHAARPLRARMPAWPTYSALPPSRIPPALWCCADHSQQQQDLRTAWRPGLAGPARGCSPGSPAPGQDLATRAARGRSCRVLSLRYQRPAQPQKGCAGAHPLHRYLGPPVATAALARDWHPVAAARCLPGAGLLLHWSNNLLCSETAGFVPSRRDLMLHCQGLSYGQTQPAPAAGSCCRPRPQAFRTGRPAHRSLPSWTSRRTGSPRKLSRRWQPRTGSSPGRYPCPREALPPQEGPSTF